MNRLAFGLTIGGLIGPAAGQATGPFAELEVVLARAMEKVAPSVVRVETFGGVRKVLAEDSAPPAPDTGGEDEPEEREPSLGPLVQPGFLQTQGATTGVVLTRDGWILVSRFALNYDPSTILVTTSDGRSLPARRAGEDTSRGLALVKVDAEDLPVPEFAHADSARVGQWAFVLGRTFGRDQPSVHMGILSAVDRLFGRALQTDAHTSPANYGGPLIDVRGRVLGISVPLSRSGRDAGAELYDSGIGFAATVVGIEPLLARMKRGEVLHRGWMGVTTAPEYLGPGAVVRAVLEGGVTELRAGDLILEVDGAGVKNGFHLQSLVSSRMGGDSLAVSILRGNRRMDLQIAMRDLPTARRDPVTPDDEAGVQPREEGDKKPSGR